MVNLEALSCPEPPGRHTQQYKGDLFEGKVTVTFPRGGLAKVTVASNQPPESTGWQMSVTGFIRYCEIKNGGSNDYNCDYK